VNEEMRSRSKYHVHYMLRVPMSLSYELRALAWRIQHMRMWTASDSRGLIKTCCIAVYTRFCHAHTKLFRIRYDI